MSREMKIKCTPKEAYNIHQNISADVYLAASDCFESVIKKEMARFPGKHAYNNARVNALMSVYVMGYVSGIRAEREKRTIKQNQKGL